MAFSSTFRPKEMIVNDLNWKIVRDQEVINGEKKSRGLIPRDRSIPTPYMKKFDIPYIPRAEWPERVEEMEKTKSRLSDLCDLVQLKCKDQDGTNYCWINGPVYCCEVIRVVQNQPIVYLSPASVGGPIKGYRNVGGWGAEGLEYIIEHGVVPEEFWPANAIDRSYDTEQTRALRQDYRVSEWYDLPEGDFDALFTCLLMRIPVAVGYNWWGHEVSAIDPVVISKNNFGIRIRNSWGMDYGDAGYAILNESKGTPDDAVAPMVMYATAI